MFYNYLFVVISNSYSLHVHSFPNCKGNVYIRVDKLHGFMVFYL